MGEQGWGKSWINKWTETEMNDIHKDMNGKNNGNNHDDRGYIILCWQYEW